MSDVIAARTPEETETDALETVVDAATGGFEPAGGDPPSNRVLARSSLIYAGSLLLFRAGSVIMLPLTTRLLTPAEYGLVYLIQLVLDVANLIITEGTTAGFTRFYLRAARPRRKSEVFTGTFVLLIAQQLIGAILLIAFAPVIAHVVLKDGGSPNLVRLAGVNFFLAGVTAVPLLQLQAEQKALQYATYTLLQLVLNVGLSVVFLAVMRLGVWGMLLATTTGFLVLAVLLVWRTLRHTPLHWKWSTALLLRKFGVPYQLASAATFLLNFADRLVLQLTRTTAETGTYTLAYQFGFLMWSVSAAPYLLAWLPASFVIAQLDRRARDARFNEGLLVAVALTCGASALVAVTVRPVLSVVSNHAFLVAGDVVPLVLMAFVMNAFYTVFKIGADISGTTRAVPISNWAATAVALAAYALTIPRFGAWGAASSTLLGFTVRTVIMYRYSILALPVSWDLRRPCAFVLMFAGVGATAILVRATPMPTQIALGVVAFGAFAAVTWFGVLTSSEHASVLGAVRAASRKARSMLAS